jgi:hypothetical protein
MRYLLFVDIARDRRIERGAQRVEQERNLVLLDQPAYLVHCLWRTVAVDFPMRNLGYLLSAIGQAPPQRRQDHQSNEAPVYPERKPSIRWDPSSAACLGSAPLSWQAWIVSEIAL